jgi:uncharacterized protein (TIGR03382 family)
METGAAGAAGGSSMAAPAIRGSMWTMGGYAAGQILRLAGNLVLTRLLFPAVFGEMALVFIFIQGLQMFSDVGTGPAIIQNPRGDDPEFLNTAWTIQCLRGVVLWLAAWAIAWPVAAFYDQPSLRWLVPAAGFNAVISGFESTAMHALQRHLRLERLTVVEVSGQAVSIVATVLLAFADRWIFGPNHPSAVWAIIGGNTAACVIRLVLSHTYLPGIRNRFRLDAAAMKQQMTFGRWIFVSTLLTFLASQSDRLIFGKRIPLALFGVYSIATMLAALPTQAVLKLGSAVIFPAYSRLVARHDFKRVFWQVRLPLLVGSAALVAGLVASGPPLIRVLYDRRYVDAGWILQFLAATAWFQVLEVTNGAALLAKGHVKWVAAGSGVKVIAMAAIIPVGFWLGGFPGALIALVVCEALKYLTAATGTSLAGLGGLWRDTLLTCAVAASAAVAFGVGEVTVRRTSSALLAFLTSGTTAALPWALVGGALLLRRRSSRAADVAATSVRS